MRTAFVRTLVELAERDERVVLLTGDLGFMALEPFAERFPDRFFNVGVAEQNMVGVATGLAEAGFIPFVYSIATFASLRPYEFIRNGPVLHQLPVRIVGVGGGFEYGHNGVTHHALEDVGVMRVQPGMTVVAPADPAQTRDRAARDLGPARARLLPRSARTTTPVAPGSTGASRSAAPSSCARATTSRSSRSGTIAARGRRGGRAARPRGASTRPWPWSRSVQPAAGRRSRRAARRASRSSLTVEAHYADRRPRLAGRRGRSPSAGSAAALVRCGVSDDAATALTGSRDYLYETPRALGRAARRGRRARALGRRSA